MTIQLNKKLFARSRHRQIAYGEFFNKASSSMSFFVNVIFTGIFAPVVVASSLFSKDIFLMLANMTLSLGYLVNFFYRLAAKEVSYSETIFTGLGLGIALAIALTYAPIALEWELLKILALTNTIATTFNAFFLVRNIIIPPCKKLFEHCCRFLGYEIAGSYFYRTPLTLKKDQFVLDRLLRDTYGQDSFETAPEMINERIRPFNRLLIKLMDYVNKYSETLLGHFHRRDKIDDLHGAIEKLTVEGDAGGSFGFIRKKLHFKTTKMKLLQQARAEIAERLASEDENRETYHHVYHYFKGYQHAATLEEMRAELRQGLNCIDAELHFQQHKIDRLRECLPSQAP